MPSMPVTMEAPESAESSVEEASAPELVEEPVSSAPPLEVVEAEREAEVEREVLLPPPIAVPLPPEITVPLEPPGRRVPVPRTVGAAVTGLLVRFAATEERVEEAPRREETPAASVGLR